jgi:hypothetical protein
MGADNRASPRIPVSIKIACAAAEGGSLRVLDLSLGGFLGRGRIAAGEGAPFEGCIHVATAASERDVVLRGAIVRAVPDGEELLLGVRIDGFDSPEGEKAYKDYVGELYADG